MRVQKYILKKIGNNYKEIHHNIIGDIYAKIKKLLSKYFEVKKRL